MFEGTRKEKGKLRCVETITLNKITILKKFFIMFELKLTR